MLNWIRQLKELYYLWRQRQKKINTLRDYGWSEEEIDALILIKAVRKKAKER